MAAVDKRTVAQASGQFMCLAVQPATDRIIVARCHSNWPGLEAVIASHTPGGAGRWSSVAFVTDDLRAPDWYVLFNDPGRPITIEAPPNRVLFAIGEPPIMTFRPMHIGQGAGTIIMTCDKALVGRRSPARTYVLSHCLTPSWSVKRSYDALREMPCIIKSRSLSWVTSNDSFLSGQRLRLDFLERLRAHVDFDLFGHGFNPIDDKWEGLAPYRYSIAFENSVAPYYFTEKIMDCFVAETLPLYFGSSAIRDFFPPESVEIIDPQDPEVLLRIAAIVNSNLHEQRREAILEAKRLTLERYNVFAHIARFIEGYREPAAAPQALRIGRTPPAVSLRRATGH